MSYWSDSLKYSLQNRTAAHLQCGVGKPALRCCATPAPWTHSSVFQSWHPKIQLCFQRCETGSIPVDLSLCRNNLGVHGTVSFLSPQNPLSWVEVTPVPQGWLSSTPHSRHCNLHRVAAPLRFGPDPDGVAARGPNLNKWCSVSAHKSHSATHSNLVHSTPSSPSQRSWAKHKQRCDPMCQRPGYNAAAVGWVKDKLIVQLPVASHPCGAGPVMAEVLEGMSQYCFSPKYSNNPQCEL